MQIIHHRRNTIEDLNLSSTEFGIEVDIRSQADKLVIHHDPFQQGLDLEAWLDHFRHKTLILNVKEEGLEQRLIELMNARGINDFFFLDQSFPFLVKWSKQGEHRCAVRVSEFETIETALSLAGKVDWVWVDCFTRFPLSAEGAKQLQDARFRLCLVSPELQGRDAEIEIPELRSLLEDLQINAEAVCTKRPDLWGAQAD